MTILAAITALLKAIPVVARWFEQLALYYFNSGIDEMKAENLAALRKAIELKDQRDIEKALRSDHAGKPVDLPGSEIRSSIVGVVSSSVVSG